jgi:hypothetical protein
MYIISQRLASAVLLRFLASCRAKGRLHDLSGREFALVAIVGDSCQMHAKQGDSGPPVVAESKLNARPVPGMTGPRNGPAVPAHESPPATPGGGRTVGEAVSSLTIKS